MDCLNDEYPLYPPNPRTYSDLEKEEAEQTIIKLKNNRDLPFDTFCVNYSDELWYFWCMCKEHTEFCMLPFFDKMTFISFCHMCYKNSKFIKRR